MILGLITLGIGVATLRIGLKYVMLGLTMLYKYLSKET